MNAEEKLDVAAVSEPTSTMELEKPATPLEKVESLRSRRIDDFQRDALADPDALQANLGAINGGLMRMSYHMEKALEESLATIGDPIDRFERLGPWIDTYLKLTRQVDRFAQFGNRPSPSPAVTPTKPK